MRVWIALLVAPVLALADQGIAFATASWACEHQNALAAHVVHATFLAATLAATAAVWQLWRETRRIETADETLVRRHFVAGLATASGALSALAIAAMWIPTWVLAPCIN
jgi:hypothetical protein